MTLLAERAIGALQAEHELLAKLTQSLTHEQLARPSCAGDWTVAQVLSHLVSRERVDFTFAGCFRTMTYVVDCCCAGAAVRPR